MKNLDEYIFEAMTANQIKSRAEFCRMLNVSHNALNHYKNGSWPSDETMIKIANLAGVNPEIALIDLNIWRSGDQAVSVYSRMKKVIEKASLTTAALAIMATPVFAGTTQEQVNISDKPTIYYHFKFIRE